MRVRMARLGRWLVLVIGGLAALSLSRGQDVPAPAQWPSVAPGVDATRLAGTVTSTAPPQAVVERPVRDLSKLPPLHKQMCLSAQRGADWLYRMNATDGRFVSGYVPALKTVMEGDHYLRQAGAAFALARAARFTGDPRYIARATQAVLLLLGDTVVDPQDPQVRYTALPSTAVNRLATAGLLVLAINELPAPEKDLLAKSEHLCNYIRRQQRADGSLSCTDSSEGVKAADDPEGINYYPGAALYGLMRSQHHQPAAWKNDLARKALAYYRTWWRAQKNPAFVPWQTAAYAEAYLRTREQAFADFVNEMNDWVCGLQYDRLDPRYPAFWYGGFKAWSDGKPVEAAPQVSTASYAEGLAEACRLARETGDLTRHRRYSEALERSLQFLAMLQYTEANTQHFADWYRPMLLGGFHASYQDGDLRIDSTQHAVCALIQYLTYVARVP